MNIALTTPIGQNHSPFWCEPPQEEIFWCSNDVNECFEEDHQKYLRLTQTNFRTPKMGQSKTNESKNTGADLALAAIVIGGGFLMGGPIGLGVGVLFLAGCYSLEDIRGPNEGENQGEFFASDAGGDKSKPPDQMKDNGNKKDNPKKTNPCEGKPPLRSYSGPAGTEGVGICQEEIRTCSDGSYRTTQEEILPETEMPYDDLDNDCDGMVDRDSWLQVVAGGRRTCGIRTDGAVECWGQSDESPVGIFSQISVGGTHSCGVRADEEGIVDCWGDPDFGTDYDPPTTLEFTQVAVGQSHSCGLKTDGRIYCWGDNDHGELNHPGGTFSQIDAGNFYSVALGAGYIECWDEEGCNDRPTSGDFIQISAGEWSACGIRADNSVICWELLSTTYLSDDNPIETPLTQISVGFMACGITLDDSVRCWGPTDSKSREYWGTIPDGPFVQVSTGTWHACGIKTDNTIECWGLDSDGQATPPSP